MYLELIDQNELVKFAEVEFGKVTSFIKMRSKKSGEIFCNMTFRLKPNGAYEEAFFYDFEIFPIRVEDMEDRKVVALNKRYRTFMASALPESERDDYKKAALQKELLKNLKND